MTGFYVEKTLEQLIHPLDLSLVGIAVAVALLAVGYRKVGWCALAVALLWLYLWSLPPVADGLRWSLEGRFTDRLVQTFPHADAIVVLGGAMAPARPPEFPYPRLSPSSGRVWEAARLYHAGKAPVIIASGGFMPWQAVKTPESVSMGRFLEALGVPASAVILETKSVNTRQNALNVRRILRRRGLKTVLLVTSALHMRRAFATFRTAGVDAMPAATNFHPPPAHPGLLGWLPSAGALGISAAAFHEYLGYWVYRWRGWIKPR